MAKIEVLKEYCKGCGLCINACPKKIINFSNEVNKNGYKYAVQTEDSCIGCKFCALTCPDAAIEVYK